MNRELDATAQLPFLAVATAPPLIAIGLFEWFLGHRHDISGHFAAGHGATFCVAMFALYCLPPNHYSAWGPRLVLPICVACILAGVVTEATIFRLARFDEIDFFNQSLGAVLAIACASAYATRSKLPPMAFKLGFGAGVAFLAIGACLAVA